MKKYVALLICTAMIAMFGVMTDSSATKVAYDVGPGPLVITNN